MELVEGVLEHEGTAIVKARAWRIRTEPLELDPATPEPDPVPGPEEGEEVDFFPTGQDVGYHTAMEIRFVYGGFREPGAALAWMRMRVALVEGEEPDAAAPRAGRGGLRQRRVLAAGLPRAGCSSTAT